MYRHSMNSYTMKDGTVSEIKKMYDDAPNRVKRAVVSDIDKVFFPVENIVPFIDTVHDRAVVETFRRLHQGMPFLSGGNDIQTGEGNAARKR